ncbi:hypothetical protein Ancab_034688 [Ancistrocladus abbreviatus]
MVLEEGSSSVTSSPMQCFPFISLSPDLRSPYTWLRELKSEERGLCLIHLLLAYAKHVAAGGFDNANIAVEYITSLLFLVGTRCSTLLLTFLEHLLFVCSEAIEEAMEREKVLHIINLHSFEPAQWINLLWALSSQSGGLPHLKITGIHEQKDVLEMACQLNEEAEKLDIPSQCRKLACKDRGSPYCQLHGADAFSAGI